MIMYKVPEYNEMASKGYRAGVDEWYRRFSVKSLVNVIPYYCLSQEMNDFPVLSFNIVTFFPKKHLKLN